ncbi:MAG TPA: MBL fold metallo-hydrolase [Dehalococcoidia bacterium]|nr:MBL fold metallo-hydrolase [Dehalococcoidia bacterium]
MQTYEDGALRMIRVGPLGPFDNNAYVVVDREAGEAAIVDMPAGGERVLAAAAGLRVVGVLLTHTHSDHWASYDLIKGATRAPIHCHPAEEMIPKDKVDLPLADGEVVEVGSLRLRVIHTPGHTPGSVCFLVGRYLIAGDTLFPGGPGRSSRPADLQQEIRSIVDKLYLLPDDTLVLPGHGEGTTIGQSKREYAVFASRPHRPDLCGDVLWEPS